MRIVHLWRQRGLHISRVGRSRENSVVTFATYSPLTTCAIICLVAITVTTRPRSSASNIVRGTFGSTASGLVSALGTDAMDLPAGNHVPWADTLPVVALRQVYLEQEPPTTSLNSGRSKGWPFIVDTHSVVAADFRVYLMNVKNFHGQTLSDATRGVSRMLDMLESDGERILAMTMAWEPQILVSMFFNNIHGQMFQLPLLSPTLSWTRKLLEGFKLYCEFHIASVSEKYMMSEVPTWLKYKSTIEQLLAELRAGPTMRLNDEKAKRDNARRDSDRIKIRALPSVASLKTAVHRAMLALQAIERKHHAGVPLPSPAQRAATVAMVGILAFNGYLGRKTEWEVLAADHIQDQLRAGFDYIVCKARATPRVCGDLAKWLAPGTQAAAQCYLGLPRRPGVPFFLCPVGAGAEMVSVPHALRRFCERYFPEGGTHPTVNLLRKWYHTKLHSLAKKQDQLSAVFTAIDAHSAAVAKKHYILQGPEDDAALAKHLVEAMLGQPVPWPRVDAAADWQQEVRALVDMEYEDDPDVGPEEDDEAELEWFEHAEMFGIHRPLSQLALADASPNTNEESLREESDHQHTRVATEAAGGTRKRVRRATSRRSGSLASSVVDAERKKAAACHIDTHATVTPIAHRDQAAAEPASPSGLIPPYKPS